MRMAGAPRDMTRIFHLPVVEGALDREVRDPESGSCLSFFAQAFWVRATDPQDALTVVKDALRGDGASFVHADPPEEHGSLPAGMKQEVGVARARGVIWKSGRAFYPPE
jgi:hypothetical protein